MQLIRRGLFPGKFRQLPHPPGPALTPGPDAPWCPGPTSCWAQQGGRGWSVLPRFLPDDALPLPPARSPSPRGRDTAPFPARPLSTSRAWPRSPRPHRAPGVPQSPEGGGGAPWPGGAAGPPGAVTCPRGPAPFLGYKTGGAHAVGLFGSGFAAVAEQVSILFGRKKELN